VHFAETGVEVGEITEAVGNGDGVEVVVGLGRIECVALDVLDFGRALVTGYLKHGFAEVDGSDLCATGGKAAGDIAGAAAEVEGALTGLDVGQLDEAAFPAVVESEALEVVDAVVMGGDGVEKLADFAGAGFVFGEVTPGHFGEGSMGSGLGAMFPV